MHQGGYIPMKKPDLSVREKLSFGGQKLFDDVAFQRVLGASAHISIISDMIRDICTQSKSKNVPTNKIIEDVHRLTDFFINTRGNASQAISNAIYIMINGIDDFQNADTNSLIEIINDNIENFQQTNNKNLEKVSRYTLSILAKMNTILLFDYSSTVGNVVEKCENKLEILIPESRVLDGGKPYIGKSLSGHHKTHFIPDSAIFHYLNTCDGAFIGSETFYPDGRVFNTLGSEMVAYLCNQLNVPFYVLTTLLKMDVRALYGYHKTPTIINLKELIAPDMSREIIDGVDFSCPELIDIPAKNITAFITEEGIVPPSAIYQICKKYMKNIKGIA